jgi:hypothetical protein
LSYLRHIFSENKKPAELYASAGLNPVLPANFASHTRRRAMRVMVVVMVPGSHETTNVREAFWTVKLEITIANISFVDELPVLERCCTRQLLAQC